MIEPLKQGHHLCVCIAALTIADPLELAQKIFVMLGLNPRDQTVVASLTGGAMALRAMFLIKALAQLQIAARPLAVGDDN